MRAGLFRKHLQASRLLLPYSVQLNTPKTLTLFSACWFILMFLNPLNSDINYRIFIQRMSFSCVHIVNKELP